MIPPLQRSCTGLAARWCPNHGTCGCPDPPGWGPWVEPMSDPRCPLHGVASHHPIINAAYAKGVTE